MMTFELRFVVVALAAFAVSGLVGAFAAWLWASRRRQAPAADSTLLFLRLVPTLAAATGLALAVLAFVLFEQRGPEKIGLLIRGFALFSVALFLTAAWRGWRLYRRTRETMAQWMMGADPVTVPEIGVPVFAVSTEFPIVAVVGLIRQRIIIARSVLERCAPEELVAILAHEETHIVRYDNIRRALFTVTPDLLSWLPVSDRLLAAWHDRCEEAADNGASRLGERGRVLLAQALIRVARLAPRAPAVHDLPASALYRGEDLDRRIHRLLSPPAAAATRDRRVGYVIAFLIGTPVAALKPIHDAVEIAVRWLP
jgi:Zn-dependent protease with chaperone function